MRYFSGAVRPALCRAAFSVLLALGCTPAKTGTPAGGGSGPGTGGIGAVPGTGGVMGMGGASATASGGSTGSGGNPVPGGGGTGNEGTGGTTTPTGGMGNPGTGGRAGGGGAVGSGGGAVVMKMACPDAPFVDPYSPGYSDAQHQPFVTQAQTMLSSMTLADKAGQMRGTAHGAGQYTDIFRTMDNQARGIKGFLFRDGPRGVNLDAPLPSVASGGRSTVFPAPMARAASWDLDVEFRIGQAMGDEMIATGQTMLLAPTANILRHPLWGRAQETYGEDPYQLGRLSNASIVGIQQYVPACAKHYAANNIENNRFGLNAQMDEQTLREIYARHYEMMVRDGGVSCIMAAYNSVNGVKSTQDKHLLTDILRTDFGFKGFVLTDWWAMPGASSPTLATGSRSTNAAQAVLAGLDMELPWALNYSVLETITGAGLPLSDLAVNTSVTRILAQKIRFKVNSLSGAIGLKAKDPATTYSGGTVSNDAHVALALESALKSITLLKNTNNTLPIKRGTITSVAVIGANLPYRITSADPGGGMINWATNVRTGDWGSSRALADPGKSVGPFAGIQAAAGAGVTVTMGPTAAAVGNAQFVVVVAGLMPQDEGEEYTGSGDRASFALDAKMNQGTQNGLIAAVAALGKPMVVVLQGGSVIDMPWLAQVPAVVMAWYPGMVGGKALGQLLFGDVNFSAKLPITWGTTLAQYPTFNAGTTTTMEYDIGYRRFDRMNIVPLYPFGHGLSYTSFTYGNLQVPCSTVTKNGMVNVKVDITNSGTVAGDEVVMLFTSYPSTTKRRPIKELKGFVRSGSIAPGATKTVTIPLRVADLKYFDMATMSWQVETGPVKISVGPNAATLPLTDTMMVQ